jgi:putative hydrolase of the HAD superfamily
MIRAVLFDLDDTLFDHRESAAEALRRLQHAHDCFRAVPFDEFERQHSVLLEEFHPEVVSGRLGMDQARRERFRRLFERYGVTAGDDLCAGTASFYRSEYLDARRAMAGAAALLEAVREVAAVGIVSNNMLQEQKEKLQHCQLAAHVDVLIVSEEAGVSKPDPAIFRVALDALGVRPDEAVMLGDSWSADIVGARAAGVRAVWFNPLRLPSPEPQLGVPEVHALTPVADVLRVLLIS